LDHLSGLRSTIFHEPWWMEIACDGGYREATVSSGGKIVGRLPYNISRKPFGLTVLGMPLMTHVLGPALAAQHDRNATTHTAKQVTIVHELIAQLPPAAHVSFRLHGGLANTLAFDTAGFANTASFTVEIAPNPSELIWLQMRDKTRNVIRRAQEQLTTVELPDPAAFLDFYEDNLRERGRVNQYSRDICAGIIAECLKRGVGRILQTVTAAGAAQSAVFTVWDRTTEYYFMSTRTQKSMNGAVSLAIWTAIQHAAAKGLTFDMDGLHVKDAALPNVHLLTGFGGTVKPRYVVRRTSPVLRAARAIADISVWQAKRRLSFQSRLPVAA
jgi:hypothetical protein